MTASRTKRRRHRPSTPRIRRPSRARSASGVPSPRFVGRDASPVLDRYPPKEPALTLRGPPPPPRAPTPAPPAAPATPSAAAPAGPAGAPAAPGTAVSAVPKDLITLERPFDMDGFSQQLGATSLRVTVPRENLAEVLERIAEFMGFGIYVYAFNVRPAPNAVLRSFEVELQRVDFSPAAAAWQPFVERGRTDNPFGPGGDPGARR
jgi:hypothetical protein